MNPQLMGLKFELWGAELFRDISSMYPNYRGVRRNVNYCRAGAHRQVDLEYFNVLSPRPFVIMEFKYISRDYFPLKLRDDKEKQKQKVGRIEDVLDEVDERRRFVKADQAILVTNKRFEKSLRKKARQYDNIRLYDIKVLRALDHERTGIMSKALGFVGLKKHKTIEEQIHSVRIDQYNRAPYTVRL